MYTFLKKFSFFAPPALKFVQVNGMTLWELEYTLAAVCCSLSVTLQTSPRLSHAPTATPNMHAQHFHTQTHRGTHRQT